MTVASSPAAGVTQRVETSRGRGSVIDRLEFGRLDCGRGCMAVGVNNLSRQNRTDVVTMIYVEATLR